MDDKKLSTLIYPITDTHILLGKKLRGFAVGVWNGVGGKVEPHERDNIPLSACRELEEECSLIAAPEDLEHVAHLIFYVGGEYMFDNDVFFVRKWVGEAQDSEEVAVKWFALNEPFPLAEMWPDDAFWLPKILAGEKLNATFWISADNKHIERHEISPL